MNTIKFCLKCGHQLGPDDKFCLGCGANIAEMQAQQSAAGAGQNTAAVNTQATANTVNTVNTVNTQNTQNTQNPFQQPQQTGFQPQQNNFYAGGQPQPGFGAPGAAVKTGDNFFKKNLKLIIIIAVALVVCIVGFFVIKHIFFRFQKIDAKDLIKVKFSGIDGGGVASATLNKYSDSVYNLGEVTDYLGDTSLTGDDEENAKSPYFEVGEKKLLDAYTKAGNIKEAREMRDALLSESAGLKITVNGEDKAKGLKNDDTVTIKLEFNESYLEDKNIKIENAEYEVTVEGLKSGTKIDMFDGVAVKFEGNDEKGSAELDTSGAKSFVRYSFKDTYYKNLKNGDKVVVIARLRGAQYVDPNDPEGAVFVEYSDGNCYTAEKATMEKEFTVEGLTEMTKVDIFKDITIEYRNAVPYLRASKVNTENCSQEVKDGVRFYIEDSSKELKVGDTFKVKAYASNKFSNAGFVPEGTPDEDGYYVKEITVGDDAPKYLGKDADADLVAKFNAEFDKIKKQASDEAVDRTYLSGLSAGGKIKSVAFKDAKTMLYEYDEATANSSAKCYIVKQVVATVVTDKGNVTAYGLIKLRNPIVKGSEVAVDESGARVTLYKEQESLDKAVENDGKNYTITTIGAAKPAETKADEKKPEETTKETEKAPEETTTTTKKAA